MTSMPTTSTASVGTYQNLYESLFQEGYDQVVSIHCSRLFSGIFNAANTAAQSFSGKVHVVDSQQVSLGLGFQVLEAAEAIANQVPVENILLLLQQVRERVRLVAMLDTLEYVRRGGRISWARARLGALLNLKPFVEVKDRNVHNLGGVRSRKKGMARLFEMMDSPKPMKRFALLHSNAEKDARWLLENLDPDLPTPHLVVNVNTVLGAHVGPNGLGFVALFQEKPST